MDDVIDNSLFAIYIYTAAKYFKKAHGTIRNFTKK